MGRSAFLPALQPTPSLRRWHRRELVARNTRGHPPKGVPWKATLHCFPSSPLLLLGKCQARTGSCCKPIHAEMPTMGCIMGCHRGQGHKEDTASCSPSGRGGAWWQQRHTDRPELWAGRLSGPESILPFKMGSE